MEKWFNQVVEAEFAALSPLWRIIIVFLVVVVAFSLDYLFVHMVMPVVRRITQRTQAAWDDILLSEKVIRALGNIIPPVILIMALPLAAGGAWEEFFTRCCSAYIIIAVVRFLCVVTSAVFDLFVLHNQSRAQLKGIIQTVQIVFIVFGAIFVVSALINKSPVILISGLGAMAAVLMLIFQDSIKGLVAGIQLSANDMMRPGDWITMPKCGADGDVIDISLHTVKVRNWDKTIITIPPYMLVNDSFQNWRGMRDCGGRRIFRSVNIDMQTVRFCTEEELLRYQAEGMLPNEYVLSSSAEEKHIIECDAESLLEAQGEVIVETDPSQEKVSEPTLPRQMTNLQVFRHYLTNYLRKHPDLNHDSLPIIVRELQPTAEGIPLQVYCFSDTVIWVEYEMIQSQIIEFLISSLPQFGLGVYQRSSDRIV